MKESSLLNKHAVVIGCGVAGMLAARVLRLHGADVTIVERAHFNCLDEQFPKPRPKPYPHVLLARAYRTMSTFFSDLDRSLEVEGAVGIDWSADHLCITEHGTAPRFISNVRSRMCSRELLERCLRQHLLEDPKVTILGGSIVDELLVDRVTQRVVGVSFRTGARVGFPSKDPRLLFADLIVVATGMPSKLLNCFDALNYERPHSIRVPSNAAYANVLYHSFPNSALQWKALSVWSRHHGSLRAIGIYPTESACLWNVFLGGKEDDSVPTNHYKVVEFARGLQDLNAYEFFASARPASQVFRGVGGHARFLRLDSCDRLPAGVVFLGDVVCRVNPLSAKGMACAAIAAETINELLGSSIEPDFGEDWCRGFQRQLASALSLPWYLSGMETRLWQNAEFQVVGWQRWVRRYEASMFARAIRNPRRYKKYLEAFHLLNSNFKILLAANLCQRLTRVSRPRCPDSKAVRYAIKSTS